MKGSFLSRLESTVSLKQKSGRIKKHCIVSTFYQDLPPLFRAKQSMPMEAKKGKSITGGLSIVDFEF